MRKSNREVNGEKVFRYSIRKYHFGAASVAVAALMFFANGAVKADALAVSPVTANTEKVNAGVTDLTEGVPIEKSLETEGNKEIVASEPAEKISNKEDGAVSNAQDASDKAMIPANQAEEINKSETNGKEKEVVTNKDKLESLLKEIDQLNLKGYTEATVKVLQEKVAKAREVLVNAKTQKEIDLAYNELVGYKNAGLKRVPKPKGELTSKLDTTNGKETVGKKAENTEPNGTNIAGHNHSLNGTSLPEGSGLRTATKPELADVQIGRWNGTRRTFDRSNVFVTPANQGIVGNVMKIKAISASDNFTNIEVTGNQGFPLQVKKNIKGKEAELYFEGNTPSNGSWNMTVTATTAKGTKSFNFGYYTALRKPTILTQNTALEGKAKEKPTIEVEVPTFSPAPTGSKFKVYLVRGGSTNGWDNNGNAYPSGYSVLASADVVASAGGKGTATINASNYRVSELGTTAFKAITVIEVNGRENDTDPGERGSWFSDERRATVAPTIDKAGAVSAIDAKVTEKNGQIDRDTTLTTEEKTAQKGSVTSEANKAKTAINNATTNAAVETAKTNGLNAIGSVTTANKVKAGAKADLATIAAEEIKAIKADASLPASEQAKKEAEVNTKKADGELEIDNAETTDKVAQAKATAKTAIEGVHTPGDLAEVKRQAKADLATIAAEEIKAIKADASLPASEQAKKEAEVNTKKADGEQAIDAATADNADKVAQAKAIAKTAIEGVHTPGDLAEVKRQAKADLATIAAEEIKAIKADASLPASEQAKKEAEVNTKKADGEQAIDAATADNADKVAQAKEAAKTAIEGVHTPGDYVSSTSSTVQPSHPVQNDSSAQASPSIPTSQATQPAGEGQTSTLSAVQSRTDRSMEDVAKEESPVSAKQQLDKSELHTLSHELEERLKVLTAVSNSKVEEAKKVLANAQKAIADSDLTEQGLRDAVEAVRKALVSLKDVEVNDVDSKTAQDKSDVKKVAEDSKDSDKMSETNSVPTGVFVAGLLALLGVIIFWLIRRKKDSELKQLSIELTKVLEQQDVAKADKKVLAKAQKLLQETLDFVKEESGSAETEAKLVEQLKAIITKLK